MKLKKLDHKLTVCKVADIKARPMKKYPSYAKQMMYPKILLNEMMDGEDSVFREY